MDKDAIKNFKEMFNRVKSGNGLPYQCEVLVELEEVEVDDEEEEATEATGNSSEDAENDEVGDE